MYAVFLKLRFDKYDVKFLNIFYFSLYAFYFLKQKFDKYDVKFC